METYWVITTQAFAWSNLQIPVGAKYLSALLQRIFDLACREQRGSCSICPIVLMVCVAEPELVIVDDCRIEGADWELQGAAYLIDPSDTLQTYGIFFSIAHVQIGETFLDARLQHVGRCHFDVGAVWAHALAVAVGRGGCVRHVACRPQATIESVLQGLESQSRALAREERRNGAHALCYALLGER
jgi:hypothetical protein